MLGNETFTNPISYLATSAFDLARLLVLAAVIAGLVLLILPKVRNVKVGLLLLVSAAGMALVAWDVHRVTTGELTVGVTIDSSSAAGFGTYGVLVSGVPVRPAGQLILDTPNSNQLILVVSGFVLGFLGYLLVRTLMKRKFLVAGAVVVALVALLKVVAEQVKYLGDMFSPVWNAMSGLNEANWTVLFAVAVVYLFAALCTTVANIAVRKERKSQTSVNPAESNLDAAAH